MKKLTFICLSTLALILAACSCKDNPENTAPAVPSGLTLRNATESSLAIQWSSVEGAESYEWKLLQGSTEVLKNSTTSPKAIISDLKADTAYRFAVRSIKGSLASDWTSFLEVSTTAADTPDTPDTPDQPDQPVDSPKYEEFGIPEWEEDGIARAFPGAEGGGMYTTGGRGGRVLHVTTLEDSTKEGTLRWAVTQNYPRTIVFDVAGIIELNSTLNINRNDVTIAGQTAPGDGICLKNYTFRISASNVIVRFIRCRMGDEKKTEDDAMQVMSHEDNKYSNIIIDHCSVSWCTDECASFYGMKDFSFQWNIISESLRNSIHDKGSHGYGGIWGGENASYHHNLLAHHDSRNPRLDHDYVSTQKGPLSLVNNVVYNWDGDSCYGGESANKTGDYRKYNLINNYYKPGPRTTKHIWFLNPTTSCSNCSGLGTGPIVPGHFYMDGNYMYGKSSMTDDNWTGTSVSSSVISSIKASEPFSYAASPSSISIQGAENGFNAVLNYAGASFARDAVDERIANETKNGTYTYEGSCTTFDAKKTNKSTKGLIDTQNDVGGWPEYKATEEQLSSVADSDGDGMPNWFETQFGLSKSNPSDAQSTSLDKNGRYTNLEMYLHYIVRDIVAGGNANATYTKL